MRIAKPTLVALLAVAMASVAARAQENDFVSVAGDPGMANTPRVLLESWNMCNRAGRNCSVAPRWADCMVDGKGPGINGNRVTATDNAAGLPLSQQNQSNCDTFTEQKERNLGELCAVQDAANPTNRTFFWTGMLKSGNFDTWEEGKLCGLWCTASKQCDNVRASATSWADPRLRFNNLPMNQAFVTQTWTHRNSENGEYEGAFYGTWDPNTPVQPPSQELPRWIFNNNHNFTTTVNDGTVCVLSGTWLGSRPEPITINQLTYRTFVATCSDWSAPRPGIINADGSILFEEPGRNLTATVGPFNASSPACTKISFEGGSWWCRPPYCGPEPPTPPKSYFGLEWFVRGGKRIYRCSLRTSQQYPWLMLYFGADAGTGRKGGYPWDGRGEYFVHPRSSPHWNASQNEFYTDFYLNISSHQTSSSFYLLNMAACWKMDGRECDGDITSDVTRYILLDLHQKAEGEGCSPQNLDLCPRSHRYRNGTVVFREDTARFPYRAYISRGSRLRSGTLGHFDPYSNPQRQDFIKLAASPEWAEYGFPSSVQDALKPQKWHINVGGATAHVPMDGSEPSVRIWTTLNIGPEMGLGGGTGLGVWEISEFDVLVRKSNLDTIYKHH